MKPRATSAIVLLFLAAGLSWASPGALRPSPLDGVRTLFEQKRFDQVITRLSDPELQKLHRQELPKAYDLLGLSYQYQGEAAKAIGVYQLAAGLFPKDINLLTHLAELLHRSELDDRARPMYERVLAIHPNNAVANLGMAEIEHATGFLAESASYYEKALVELKDEPSVWRGYAQVLSERRDYPKAAAAIETALKLAPGDADTLNSLARFQRAEGSGATAYKTLESAIAVTGDARKFSALRPALSLERALWLLEDGRLQESLAQAQDELRNDAQNPLGLWIRASVLLRQGKTREASSDLTAVAAQGRRTPFVAQAAAAMLEELKDRP